MLRDPYLVLVIITFMGSLGFCLVILLHLSHLKGCGKILHLNKQIGPDMNTKMNLELNTTHKKKRGKGRMQKQN